MSLIIVDLLYGFAAAALGAAAACWLYRSHGQRHVLTDRIAKTRHAEEILVRLQELASRVAFDVDEHSSQVEEISNELTSADTHEPAMIVEMVAKLIEANQHMHQKLASTEDKLREQAVEIQNHASEARTDALTLLANRRAFDDEMGRRVAELSRQGRTFSLVMADVDHFKKFNDTHGHQAGDEALRAVAKLLRRTMREMDLVARYGGEEFAMILPGTNLDDACKAALRACKALDKAPVRLEEKEFPMTASFGVAEAREGNDGAALVARADKALYAAKQGGRDCVYRHDGEAVHRVAANPQPALPEAANQHQDVGKPRGGEKACTARQATPVELKGNAASRVEAAPLIELPGRTNFCQIVRNRTAEWKRGGPVFSVVLIEVNQYDHGEGQPGHLSRQTTTALITKFLGATVREMDIVGNYGPGCFALLLPTAGLIDGIRVAERLREEFSRYSTAGRVDQPKLTLSVGVVQIQEKDDSVSVLKRAEAALDAADRRGGNRAYYHDGERCAPITAMLETMGYLA